MGKTAIIIGATGLIGKNLINYLIKADHIEKIIAITRSKKEYSSKKVENKVIDFDKMHEYAGYFFGDILFSCLGTTLKKAGSTDAQRKVDLDYQYQAAKISAENGVEGYVLVSSSAANSKSQNKYLQMKGELEEKVRELSFKSIVFFRPSLLLGDRDEFRAAEKIGGFLMPVLSFVPGLKKYRPIKGEIVAQKMVKISKIPEFGLHIYELDEIFYC